MEPQKIKRTFIVDDDPFWTALFTQMLTELGYKDIITFSSGKDCLDHLHLNPKLIFLDYQMEEMDGLEVLQKIKDNFPGIGVVFCSAHEDLSVAVNAMKSGSIDYLVKSKCGLVQLEAIIKDIASNQLFEEKVY